MNSMKRVSALFLSLSFVLCACIPSSKPRNKIEFYTLEYEIPQKSSLKQLPFVLRIERFSVAPSYNTSRMIYRDSSFKRNAYILHKWRANPGNLVTYFLSRDIKSAGLFKAVLPHDSGFPSSYVLEGSIDEFFEWDTEKEWKAVMALNITLMAQGEPDISKRVLFQQTYRGTKPCKEKDPKSLAAAMSQAMAEISADIRRDVYSVLKDRK